MARVEELINRNIGVEHGTWGESVATEFLRRGGFKIIDRNARPVSKDRRLEIDIVAWDPEAESLVFIEVKQHAKISSYARRLRSVDQRKRMNLRRAFNAWRRVNKWMGSYRFDVIEIYGTPDGGRPIVDHIKRVGLFTRADRFVKWD